jgi:hypothetical protein
MSNLSKYLPQVVKAIRDYGYLCTLHRHSYDTDERGMKTLTEPYSLVTSMYAVIDNSQQNQSLYLAAEPELGAIKESKHVVIYVAFDQSVDVRHGDVVMYQGASYEVLGVENLLHHNLLYRLQARQVFIDVEN